MSTNYIAVDHITFPRYILTVETERERKRQSAGMNWQRNQRSSEEDRERELTRAKEIMRNSTEQCCTRIVASQPASEWR